MALIGQNGAGKTTLAKHLNGILRPTSGRILIDGVDLATADTAQWPGRWGTSFRIPTISSLDSVRKEFEFGPRQLGFDQDLIERRMEQVAELVGLADRLDDHPFDLSPTEKKFCAIGSVLMMDTGAVVFTSPPHAARTRPAMIDWLPSSPVCGTKASSASRFPTT
ncbi:ATP-binding cassette domain-containing protein [Bifidobacterium sp. ESL0825]|uniref:ATP-binding cassette domain-containing protein n=1 Tax=Bifidobacterium sp. ESL0825 TaxID=3448587 RepID=UPI0040414A17